jgi:hypothetical protein
MPTFRIINGRFKPGAFGIKRRGLASRLGLGEETMRRGWMATRALRRLAGADDKLYQLGKEKRLFDRHRRAGKRRRDVDEAMDAQARVYGVVLGWYLGPNENHCEVCVNAHGKNFFVGRRPAIGFPGTVHGDTCGCSAGAPWPNAPMLP